MHQLIVEEKPTSYGKIPIGALANLRMVPIGTQKAEFNSAETTTKESDNI